ERVLALAVNGVEQVLDRAATTRPALLAQEQGRGGEHRTTPMAVERHRVAIQEAMDRGELHPHLRADLLAAQAYDGFHRAALLWARNRLDADGFRARALYSACVCLLAVATEKSRPTLLETARALEDTMAGSVR
ncbi:MAG: hypothetical protein AAGA65_04260, partial [Actinomycetota bacterium]